VFFGLYASYVVYALTRATFTFMSPTLQREGLLSLAEIGAVASAFPMMYGGSKLISGFIADNMSPRLVLGSGMILTGLANLGLALARGFRGFGLTWALNGLVQGVGAGAVARVLTMWYTRKERGFWWAFWSTSSNFGGFLAPLVCGFLVSNFQWQAGALFPGIGAIVLGLLMIPLLRDEPEDLGYTVPHDPNGTSSNSVPAEGDEKMSYVKLLLERVLFNKTLWFLAVSNCFIYFLRSGMRSWHHFYLADTQKIRVAEAAYRVSGMEIGGLLGTFSSGVVSDKVKGSRIPVMLVYLAGLAVTILFVAVFPKTTPLIDSLAISMLGFFINGPQCLLGLVAAESVDRRIVATATGILGWISYLGAAISGYPISLFVNKMGWNAYLSLLFGSTLASALFLIPVWCLATHKR